MDCIEEIKAEFARRIELYNSSLPQERWIRETYKSALAVVDSLAGDSVDGVVTKDIYNRLSVRLNVVKGFKVGEKVKVIK